jgi:hypothetical protein
VSCSTFCAKPGTCFVVRALTDNRPTSLQTETGAQVEVERLLVAVALLSRSRIWLRKKPASRSFFSIFAKSILSTLRQFALLTQLHIQAPGRPQC